MEFVSFDYVKKMEMLKFVEDFFSRYLKSNSPYTEVFCEESNELCAMATHETYGDEILDTVLKHSRLVECEEHRSYLFISVFEVLYEKPIWKPWEMRLSLIQHDPDLRWIEDLWIEAQRENRMKALSVVLPAGDRIASGEKTIEVRQWNPDSLPLKDLVIVQNKLRLSSESSPEDDNGKIVAIVDVVNVRPWLESDVKASCSSHFEEGWLAWELSNVRKVNPSLKVPAKLGIYEVDVAGEILDAL